MNILRPLVLSLLFLGVVQAMEQKEPSIPATSWNTHFSTGYTSTITALAVSSKGILAVGTEKGEFYLIDLNTKRTIQRFLNNRELLQQPLDIIFSPSGNKLCCITKKGIFILNAIHKQERALFLPSNFSIEGVAISKCEKYMFCWLLNRQLALECQLFALKPEEGIPFECKFSICCRASYPAAFVDTSNNYFLHTEHTFLSSKAVENHFYVSEGDLKPAFAVFSTQKMLRHATTKTGVKYYLIEVAGATFCLVLNGCSLDVLRLT